MCSAVVLSSFAFIGCNGEGADGPVEILPNVSPVRMGQMWPLGDEVDDPGTNERVPFEVVILLTTESGGLEVDSVCLEGTPDALAQFALEGPVPEVPKRDEDAALRVTYERQAPGPQDNVAVVVQSNAENFPTLVIPVCAQVIAEGEERIIFECTSPVTVPPGERDDTLCAN